MKERLTGAIILVALLVLLVPELLTGPSTKPGTRPAGAEGAQLRSYTIDLQDDAAGRAPQTSAPATVVADDPVGRANVEPDAEPPPVASVTPPVDEATRAAGRPMGSGADVSAAAPSGATPPASAKPEAPTSGGATKSEAQASAASAKPSTGAASADDDRPRSAFGPNAVTRPPPDKPASATRSADVSKSASAKAGTAKPEAAASKPAAPKSDAPRVAAAKPADTPKPTAADTPKAAGSQGWAVQLGVFASRENADRLAKDVKGSGYPVVVNEISGNGKKLYRVRVGPEADRAAAVALGTRLRSAGHAGSVVPYP